MRLTPLKRDPPRQRTGQPAGAVSFHFFRKNLKRPSEFVTLADEIEHVMLICKLKRRASSRGCRSTLHSARIIPAAIARVYPATDSGNAIKHGTSQLLDTGRVAISADVRGNI